MKDGKFEIGDVVGMTGLFREQVAAGLVDVKVFGGMGGKLTRVYETDLTYMGALKHLSYDRVVEERDELQNLLNEANATLSWVVQKFVKPALDGDDDFSVENIVRMMKLLVKTKMESVFIP
jgi:hypothetical protein